MNAPSELAQAFRRRPADANKRTVGTVAVVGGSAHYVHAPVIAGLGARAAGAGLVQLVVPEASRIAAGALVPEATFLKLTATCVPPKADVTVMGMGLGTGVSSELIVSRLLSGSDGRFVLDADALSILASWYGRTDGYDPAKGQELVLTPHEGEFSRIGGDISQGRLQGALAFSKEYGNAVLVLKGYGTLVCRNGEASVNLTGGPALAKGGSGDVLCGVICGLLAQGIDPFYAVQCGVYIHGAAGDIAAERFGDYSVTPSDLISCLPEIFKLSASHKKQS